MAEVKKEKKELSTKLSSAETSLDQTKKELVLINESNKANKKTSENSLKYLINLDRNIRRKNVTLFGVPENYSFTIADEPANTRKSMNYYSSTWVVLT